MLFHSTSKSILFSISKFAFHTLTLFLFLLFLIFSPTFISTSSPSFPYSFSVKTLKHLFTSLLHFFIHFFTLFSLSSFPSSYLFTSYLHFRTLPSHSTFPLLSHSTVSFQVFPRLCLLLFLSTFAIYSLLFQSIILLHYLSMISFPTFIYYLFPIHFLSSFRLYKFYRKLNPTILIKCFS